MKSIRCFYIYIYIILILILILLCIFNLFGVLTRHLEGLAAGHITWGVDSIMNCYFYCYYYTPSLYFINFLFIDFFILNFTFTFNLISFHSLYNVHIFLIIYVVKCDSHPHYFLSFFFCLINDWVKNIDYVFFIHKWTCNQQTHAVLMY